MSPSRRAATHAGSWYQADGRLLSKQLTGWLNDARSSSLTNGVSSATPPQSSPSSSSSKLCAIIVPHAGYSYSGSTAAYAFSEINPHEYDRIFLFGPSHHAYMTECMVSGVEEFETPLGVLKIDHESRKKLKRFGLEVLEKEIEEEEHSIELCLPWISKIFEKRLNDICILPILVGSLTNKGEKFYGQFFSYWLKNDSRCLFVISSDFCHWGNRFGFVPWKQHIVDANGNNDCDEENVDDGGNSCPIWQFIENLDRQGMKFIESHDSDGFVKYYKRTRNTICGRHPIAILLYAIKFCQHYGEANSNPVQFRTRFVRYKQSSKCYSTADSSVSYASALICARR